VPGPHSGGGSFAALPHDTGNLLSGLHPDLPGSLVNASSSLPTTFTDPTIPSAGSNLLSAAADPMSKLAHDISDAAAAALKALAGIWANPPSPGLGTPHADGTIEPSGPVTLLQGSLAWYTAAIAVVAVLLAAGRMAWQHRGQPLIDLLRGLGTLVLVSAASLTVVTLLVGAADAFSVWILSSVTPDVGTSLTSLVVLPQDGDVPVVLLLFLDSIVMIGAVVQVVLLVGRGVVLVLLTGLLPLTAAGTSTDAGRAVFNRTLAWLLAFVLYQPVAASIYAVVILVAPSQQGSPVLATITGATGLILALVALPALLRLLRPAVTVALSTHRSSEGTQSLPTGARTVPPIGASPQGSTPLVVAGSVPATTRALGAGRAVGAAQVLPGTAGAHRLDKLDARTRPRAISAGEPAVVVLRAASDEPAPERPADTEEPTP